jgi:hypothetical protein
MKKLFLILALVLVLGSITIASAQSPNRVEGVWQVLTLDGRNVPADYLIQKIYTEGHFTWIMANEGAVLESVAGTYTFDGETLTESIRFAISPKMVGKSMVSKLTLADPDTVSQLGGIEGEKADTEDATWTRIK